MERNSGDGGVWVYVEQWQGFPLDVGLELLGEGRRLAAQKGVELAAVFCGAGTRPNASRLLQCGADRVYLADDPRLNYYCCERYAPLLSKMVQEYKPAVFLFGATTEGKDLAAAVAARLQVGLTAHVSSFDFNEQGELEQYVPAFGGRLLFICKKQPSMATVAPGVFDKPEPRQGSAAAGIIEEIKIPIPTSRARILSFKEKEKTAPSLSAARTIVAGGAGIGSPEGWALLEKLAGLLGGMVGATRPAVDEGWAAPGQMIGQSGLTVRPQLYLSFGISGDQLHISGVKKPELFVAVNKDPGAEIFRYAHYGVQMDYKKIISHLIDLLE